METYFDIALKLGLACILGGFIGFQRESVGRPAGLRTHILVSVSSALVMVLSDYIFRNYNLANADPARLGAQVISGIGFLGAGSIISDGMNVKGLTTAAGLWAVACIGLAVGSGMYGGAIIATFFIYITLLALKKFEDHVSQSKNYRKILVCCEDVSKQIARVDEIMRKHNVHVHRIDFNRIGDNQTVMKLHLKFRAVGSRTDLMTEIADIPGVINVREE